MFRVRVRASARVKVRVRFRFRVWVKVRGRTKDPILHLRPIMRRAGSKKQDAVMFIKQGLASAMFPAPVRRLAF